MNIYILKVDLERVVRETDIDILQAFLENLTFSNLREDDLRFMTDQNVIKLFRISQMTIEYLLFAQDRLSSDLHELSVKYTLKKRNLLKKRKEFVDLQESVKHLKGELKSKRKGITTLEGLLKDASRTRGTIERSKLVSNSILPPVATGNADEYIRFFVSCHDGLCVELTSRKGSKVWELKSEVRRGNKDDFYFTLIRLIFFFLISAFISRRDETVAIPDSKIRILHKGILLQDETALMDNNVQNGDTLTAVFDVARDDDDDETPKDTYLQEMIQKQQDALSMISEDIKQGLEAALKKMVEHEVAPVIVSSPPAEIKGQDIDGKMNALEVRISNQLTFQLAQYERMLQELSVEQRRSAPSPERSQSSILPGKLEDDDGNITLGPLVIPDDGRIEELEKKIDSRDQETIALKEALSRQAQEIENLKSMLSSRLTAAATAPVDVSNEGFTVLKAPVAKPVKKNKWRDMSGTENASEVLSKSFTEVVVTLQQTEIAAEVDEPKVETSPMLEEDPRAVEDVIQEFIEDKPIATEAASTPVVLDDIVVVFSKKNNQDLEVFGKPFVNVILSRYY